MKKTIPLLAFLALTQIASLPALQMEGVNVPPQVTVDGKTLKLNGAGVRTVVLLVVPIKAYVGAFYTPTPLRSEAAVMASPGPFRFDFTFLQAVSQSQGAQAWQAQFKDSATFQYQQLTVDVATFSAFFGPIRQLGVQSVEISGDVTRVFENGTLKGTIPGRNFQKAFLSLWFGSNPVTPSLKSAFLNGQSG